MPHSRTLTEGLSLGSRCWGLGLGNAEAEVCGLGLGLLRLDDVHPGSNPQLPAPLQAKEAHP